jgi:Ala-tRNA(Pro) deacylase
MLQGGSMVTARLKQLLDSHAVEYKALPHPTAYDSQRTAEAAHVPGHAFAKTVVLRADGRLCMAVLPATDYVHLNALRAGLGAEDVTLADEDELREAFPDCDVGAMPPFGALYGMEVFISPHLRENEDIAFNAGSHDEALWMHYRDYERVAQPTLLRM